MTEPRTYRLADLLWTEVRECIDRGWKRVIIPCGAQEAHGSIGLATDTIIPTGLADGIAPKLQALIAPPVAYGMLRTLAVYPGSISLSRDTYYNLLIEICTGLIDTGFTEIIFLNGHSGNRGVLKDVAYQLHMESRIHALVYDWYGEPKDLSLEFFDGPGGHSGSGETSMVVAIQPEAAPGTWNKEDAGTLNPAISAYPGPYSIILMEENNGLPDFDKQKAHDFYNKVVDLAAESIRKVLDRWDKLDIPE